MTHTIRDLTANEVFDPEFGAALRNVIAICNRAIHGEEIRDADARQMIEAGIDLLEALESKIRNYAVTHPVETSVVDPKDPAEYQNARYRLTTIVPFVDKPERRVYELTQDELNSFFDGYPEFAEFVIALERIT